MGTASFAKRNDELLKKEVGPIYSQMTTEWSVAQQPGLTGTNENGKGVNVMEFHQIKSIDGNVVTFYEPIMHEVDIAYNDYDGGWVIRDYKYLKCGCGRLIVCRESYYSLLSSWGQ